jgi:hypothetical protein
MYNRKEPFEILAYVYDLYNVNTKKYEGNVIVSPEPNRVQGYGGRRIETVNGVGYKNGKGKQFKGEYITELVPICGKAKKE